MAMKLGTNSIEVVKRMRPPQMVASQLKIFHPGRHGDDHGGEHEGDAQERGFMPLVNIWCAQTRKPKMAMAMLEKAIIL